MPAFPSRRERRAQKIEKPFPGTARCCPKCGGGQVATVDTPETIQFYGRKIAVCGTCQIAWEPVDESLIWDRTDPACSFSEPCDNCAFRPGSPEQADTAKWKEMVASLRAGASFYCHKGVALDPRGEHGFAYPRNADGKPAVKGLRLCRGYLNALTKWWDTDEPESGQA